jgi:hypothetical protein
LNLRPIDYEDGEGPARLSQEEESEGFFGC